jgi:hypothetical protein
VSLLTHSALDATSADLPLSPATAFGIDQPSVLAATSGIDWSEVHAVRLLGIALGILILLWAIRRMFGGRK